MLKVGDKPILQTIIEKFKESGYQNFIICVNYKSKVITEYFRMVQNRCKYRVHKRKIKMGTVESQSFKKKTKTFFCYERRFINKFKF